MNLLPALRHAALILAATTCHLWTADRASGVGFILGESKEELALKYDVSVTDHGTGRVTVAFTLVDEGRLRPLDEVQLVVPGEEENEQGGQWMDLVVAIEMAESDGGNRVGRIHIRKDWAERAEVWLNTHTMDGKRDPLTRLHHVIPIAKGMHGAGNTTTEPASPPALRPAGPPTTERQQE